MILHDPVFITSRLLPGVKVGDATISIRYDKETSDGRRAYRYFIDFDNAKSFSKNDLASGVGGGTLQEGLSSLLSFLSAFAESCRGTRGDNADLFPKRLEEWAVMNSDELGMLSCWLEEQPHLIDERKDS